MQQETNNNLQKTTIYDLPYDIFYCISKFVNLQKLADSSKTLKKINEKLYKYNLNLYGTIMYYNGSILKNTITDNIQLKFKIKPIYDRIDYIGYTRQTNINFDDSDTQNINKSLVKICKKIIYEKYKICNNNSYENSSDLYNHGTIYGCAFKIYYRKYNSSYGEFELTMQFKFNKYFIIFKIILSEKNGNIIENYFLDNNSLSCILAKQ